MQNISRKHRIALYTKVNHYNYRLGVNSEYGRSEHLYRLAEKASRSRHAHKLFRKAIKKGGIL